VSYGISLHVIDMYMYQYTGWPPKK